MSHVRVKSCACILILHARPFVCIREEWSIHAAVHRQIETYWKLYSRYVLTFIWERVLFCSYFHQKESYIPKGKLYWWSGLGKQSWVSQGFYFLILFVRKCFEIPHISFTEINYFANVSIPCWHHVILHVASTAVLLLASFFTSFLIQSSGD